MAVLETRLWHLFAGILGLLLLPALSASWPVQNGPPAYTVQIVRYPVGDGTPLVFTAPDIGCFVEQTADGDWYRVDVTCLPPPPPDLVDYTCDAPMVSASSWRTGAEGVNPQIHGATGCQSGYAPVVSVRPSFDGENLHAATGLGFPFTCIAIFEDAAVGSVRCDVGGGV